MSAMMSETEYPLLSLMFLLTTNQQVGGSSPFRRTIKKTAKMPYLQGFQRFLVLFCVSCRGQFRTKMDTCGQTLMSKLMSDLMSGSLINILVFPGISQAVNVSFVQVFIHGHHSCRWFSLGASVLFNDCHNFFVQRSLVRFFLNGNIVQSLCQARICVFYLYCHFVI